MKTVREQLRNLHYFAPEYQYTQQPINTAIDVYAFGVCALEVRRFAVATQSHARCADGSDGHGITTRYD